MCADNGHLLPLCYCFTVLLSSLSSRQTVSEEKENRDADGLNHHTNEGDCLLVQHTTRQQVEVVFD